MFCFPLWRPSDLFNKPVEHWLTVHGHTGLEVFFFYPLLHVTSLCQGWESWLPLCHQKMLEVLFWWKPAGVLVQYSLQEVYCGGRAWEKADSSTLAWLSCSSTRGNPTIYFQPFTQQTLPEQITSDLWGHVANPTFNGTNVEVSLLLSVKLATQIDS